MSVPPREKTRRFLPEPIETSSRSSQGASRGRSADLKTKQGREQGVCTSSSSCNSPRTDSSVLGSSQNETGISPRIEGKSDKHERPLAKDLSPNESKSTRRRFSPQLMETEKRSFRRQTKPDFPSPEAPSLSGRNHDRFIHPSSDMQYESRFSYSNLLKRHETRRHSFRVPDLPAIPSSCSEASDESGQSSRLASIPAWASGLAAGHNSSQPSRRESCDEQFADYLLSLEARSAEMQLQEQALAAFPNEQVHQPVDHFAIDREEDESSVEGHILPGADHQIKYRRASSADLTWELDYMRRHKEEAEMRDRAMAGTKGGRLSHAAMPTSTPDVGGRYYGGNRGYQDLAQMKHTKSPPMLGGDLVFPQSLSPQTSICESNADADHNRGPRGASGLWHAGSRHDQLSDNNGLWMGTCKVDGHGKDSRGSSLRHGGVVDEHRSPGNNASLKFGNQPRMEQPAESYSAQGEESRQPPADFATEFHDGFVTQIYNYLSLGYPCVARYYDHELSKGSGIPVSDLRRDDLNTDAKGYVGVSEGAASNKETKTNACVRWTALRIYIHKWAKQHPAVEENDGILETWGVRERRGSWAG
ncbi:hypothetical protein BDV59DRAFT_189747 [Aspergillus ambiguus]|uniref:uncharacterized protein n=1 Tax=Aspergillus ambiguus TaxID=176160 RepID=UPI003CCDCB7A